MSPSSCLTLHAPSLAATHAIAAALAGIARAGDVIVLAGEMGAGKTAFAQGFGRAIGVVEPITSPTFTLVQTYESPMVKLHHADVYRLEQYAELADLALAELAEFNGLVLVEWGDVVSTALGDHLEVRLLTPPDASIDSVDSVELLDRESAEPGEADDGAPAVGPTERDVEISARGRQWASRWPMMQRAVAEWVVAC